ncbi:MAG TPA: hypothetical protein VHP36_03665 [Chitinispirillaceae bacterium]|nr:hypothetical protein [Chitinispirillaceae bacterium]
MDQHQLLSILDQLHNHSIDVEQAFNNLKDLPFQDLGHAKIDHHRTLRKGYPEVIFCQNKTSQQVVRTKKEQY